MTLNFAEGHLIFVLKVAETFDHAIINSGFRLFSLTSALLAFRLCSNL